METNGTTVDKHCTLELLLQHNNQPGDIEKNINGVKTYLSNLR